MRVRVKVDLGKMFVDSYGVGKIGWVFFGVGWNTGEIY